MRKIEENTAIAISEIDNIDKFNNVRKVFKKSGFDGDYSGLTIDFIVNKQDGYLACYDVKIYVIEENQPIAGRLKLLTYEEFIQGSEPAQLEAAEPMTAEPPKYREAAAAMELLGYKYDPDVGKWYKEVREYVNND